MDFKVITKCCLALYFLLVVSGIPIGFIMAEVDPSGSNVPKWLVVYKYLAVFLISAILFYFLTKKQKSKPFAHGIVIVLLVTGVSAVVDFLIFPEVDYFGWLLDFSLILASLTTSYGISLLQRKIQTRS